MKFPILPAAFYLVLIGAGCSSATPQPPNNDAVVSGDERFPVELIGKESSVKESWLIPIELKTKEGCVTNPQGDLGTDVVDPNCKVWSEAIVSADKTVVAQVVPVDVQTQKGVLRFLKNGVMMSVPSLPVYATERVSVQYLNAQTIVVRTGVYEGYRQLRLRDGVWDNVKPPQSVLAAYPWEPKPPFILTLGNTYDKYTEFRWPPGGEGYFGDDPYRSKWALAFIVDRATGNVVATEVVAR